MKKIKIFLLFIMVVLVGGCSCSNEECKCPNDSTTTENHETVVINDYSELYKQTVQSVVMIRVQKKNDKSSVLATGSGVVAYQVENRAYVYTNAHVVKGVTTEYEVEIIFSDENGFPSGESQVVNSNYVYKDLYEDVAVIEIRASSKYKLATLADSDKLERGDWIYTIGSPLSKFNYTTSGNVSSTRVPIGLDSSKTGVNTTVYAIMFDAAINEGNSGGALFNSKGELVGITTLKYDEVYGMYGALPINFFDVVAKYLMVNDSNYVRPALNIELLSIDEMGSRKGQYGISDYITSGAYILSSREASISAQNIITAVNGKTIKSAADFVIELLKYNVGNKITITTVDKDNLSIKTVEVTLH